MAELKLSNTNKAEVIYHDALSILNKGIETSIDCEEAIKACLKLEKIASALRYAAKSYSGLDSSLRFKAAEYAEKHKRFINLKEIRDGVSSGRRFIDGCGDVTLTLANGSISRVDGEAMTQSFLAKLPKEWVKTKLELDTTGIERLGVDEKVLKKRGLVYERNPTWSVADKGAS